MPAHALTRRPLTPAGTRWIGWITAITLVATAVYFGLWNRTAVVAGGNTWIHGEWLINYAAGLVRRGASGATVLALSDVTGLSPLVLVEALQTGAVVALVLTALAALRACGSPPLLAVLSLSPAFILFWLTPLGTHGKEMLGYLTFLPLFFPAATARGLVPALVAAVLIYTAAGLFYEPNILFGAALLVALWLLRQRCGPHPAIGWAAVGVVLSGGAVAALTLGFPAVTETAPICEAVRARGVGESICHKFGWSGESLDEALAFTASRVPGRSLPRFLLAIAAALAPFAVLVAVQRTDRRLLAAIGAQALIFTPLYAMGIDYGRWLHVQVSSIVLLVLVAALTGRLVAAPVDRGVVWGLLALSFAWSLHPVSGSIEPGLAFTLLRAGD